MNLLCRIFGHKPQEGVWSGAEYMHLGNWGTIDGIGREHASLVARCARCGEKYTAGKLHLPERPPIKQRITPGGGLPGDHNGVKGEKTRPLAWIDQDGVPYGTVSDEQLVVLFREALVKLAMRNG